MLTYAFDLLYAIYEEEGYEPAEIPEKILTHNLYGIEIDERAGELAAFRPDHEGAWHVSVDFSQRLLWTAGCSSRLTKNCALIFWIIIQSRALCTLGGIAFPKAIYIIVA
jgi:hypothetical protein